MRLETDGVKLSINSITKKTVTIQIADTDYIIVFNKENKRLRVGITNSGDILYDSQPKQEEDAS